MQHELEFYANAVVDTYVLTAEVLKYQLFASDVPEYKLYLIQKILGFIFRQLTTRMN